jgi:hypothetical protein
VSDSSNTFDNSLPLNTFVSKTKTLHKNNWIMKQEWKKHDKKFYLPGQKPEIIQIPAFRFFSIKGSGDPNDEIFGEYIRLLYSLSYAIKMSPKSGIAPKEYFDYAVYPLEGIWDLKDDAKKVYGEKFDKKDLVYNLMIRQPDFVSEVFAQEIIQLVKKKKPSRFNDCVKFESIEDGMCVQMLHVGSYDDEPQSFAQMHEFTNRNGLRRSAYYHREIYLSDARKTSPEKLKTALRFPVTNN